MPPLVATSVTDIQWIPLDQIEANPFQTRRTFAETEMAELTASVKEHGVLQNIVVRPISGKKHKGVIFQIVAGERRWRASIAAELESIPAAVRKLTDIQALEITIIENAQREDPDDWGTALGLKRYMEMSAAQGEPLSEIKLARRIKMSVGYVRNFLGLFKLEPALQEVVQRHQNVKSAAYEIQKVKNSEQFPALVEELDKGASFRDIKEKVEKVLQNEEHKRESQRAPDRDTRSAQRKDAQRHEEARREIKTALNNAIHELRQAATWLEHSPNLYESEVAHQMPRIKKLLDEMSP